MILVQAGLTEELEEIHQLAADGDVDSMLAYIKMDPKLVNFTDYNGWQVCDYSVL